MEYNRLFEHATDDDIKDLINRYRKHFWFEEYEGEEGTTYLQNIDKIDWFDLELIWKWYKRINLYFYENRRDFM